MEKPRRPVVPTSCLQCSCRWYFPDEDGDWLCLMCGRTLVVWSRYRYEVHRWQAGLEAIAAGYKRKEGLA